MNIQQMLKVLTQLLGGKKQTRRGITDLLTDRTETLSGQVVDSVRQSQRKADSEVPVREEIVFSEHLGLSEEYRGLIVQRIDRPGPGSLMNGYPSDESFTEETIVDRNLLARELLWASRREENTHISVNLEDEAARLLEININQDEDPQYACDTLRILYSKRKDWHNAARVVDRAIETGSSQDYWNDEMQAGWEKKRERIRKQGF